MRNPIKKKYVLLLLFVSTAFNSNAFVYGEHKQIGNEAFSQFFRKFNTAANSFFFSALGIASEGDKLAFLSVNTSYPVSYGTINGLGGDHEKNPMALYAHLLDKDSKLNAILNLHEEYLGQGFLAAPDTKLTKLDFRYATMAITNRSHFYMYGKDLNDHLKNFNPALIALGMDSVTVAEAFNKLNEKDPLTMYLTVHLMALHFAGEAGRIYHGNPLKALILIQKAILYNGFADHFLEDIFSSGHLIVNRSIFSSFTNNKALHDFYSKQGTTVIDRNGEVWKTYGDGFLSKGGKDKAVNAVYESLNQILQAFSNSAIAFSSIGENIILNMIPLPYGTDIKKYFPKQMLTTEAKQASEMLPQRNFIRSRVANGIELGRVIPFYSKRYLMGTEVRFNFGNFSGKYKYNDEGTKKGQLDNWYGYTLSYGFGRIVDTNLDDAGNNMRLLKGGLRSNYDFWVSNKRFVGLANYLETGLLFSEGRTTVAFVPSLGLQLGSLINLNYYNLHPALRIPIQFLLPLQFRAGSLLTTSTKPSFFYSIDLTIAF